MIISAAAQKKHILDCQFIVIATSFFVFAVFSLSVLPTAAPMEKENVVYLILPANKSILCSSSLQSREIALHISISAQRSKTCAATPCPQNTPTLNPIIPSKIYSAFNACLHILSLIYYTENYFVSKTQVCEISRSIKQKVFPGAPPPIQQPDTAGYSAAYKSPTFIESERFTCCLLFINFLQQK